MFKHVEIRRDFHKMTTFTGRENRRKMNGALISTAEAYESEQRLLSEALEALWEQTDIQGTVAQPQPRVTAEYGADALVDLVCNGQTYHY
jgi:hypothetical protein